MMLKKISRKCFALLIALTIMLSSLMLPLTTASVSFAGDEGCGGDAMLGMPLWHRGLTCENGAVKLEGTKIGTVAFIIVLNIIDMILRLAGIAAVIRIIYGGIKYILAGYNANQAAVSAAKTVIITSICGLVIVIAAASIVTFVVGGLK